MRCLFIWLCLATFALGDEYEVKFFSATAPTVVQDGDTWVVTGLSDPAPTVENISPPPPPPPSPNDIVYRTPYNRPSQDHDWENTASVPLVIEYDRAIFDSDNTDIMSHAPVSLKIAPNGDIYVAVVVRDQHSPPSVYEGSGFVVAKSEDDGATWTEVLRHPMGGDAKKPGLVPNGAGSFNIVIQQKGDNAGESWENPDFPPDCYCLDLQGNVLKVYDRYSNANKIRKFYSCAVTGPGGVQVLYDREQRRLFTTTDGGVNITQWLANAPIKNETAQVFDGDRLWMLARNTKMNYLDAPYSGDWTEVHDAGLGTHAFGGIAAVPYAGSFWMACRRHFERTHWVLHEVSLTPPYGYTEILSVDEASTDGGYSSMDVYDDGSGPALYVLYDAATPPGWTSKQYVPWLIKLKVSQ